MAKYDEEAKALSGDNILAAKLTIKFLDVLLRIASVWAFFSSPKSTYGPANW